ncbi:DUF4862 family protein [Ruania suaedae]|uniref:DUF4862 family protein n=1 Tax=Ruania suaedae TaxID=2897774 RepID=UPI001E59F64F|nr:DUF4862 family protein [Ruania suaedae]UFU04373.1 DUF4862 family protein [Ruania suaedae]
MGTAPGVIVGAYAASPTSRHWGRHLERTYLDELAQIEGVEGLEVPWITSLHPYEDSWYADRLPAGWQVVITHIGGVMHRLSIDPVYGLASTDLGGRRRALADVARICEDVARLNEARGESAVRAIELHSAPATAGATSSAQALAESLTTVGGWDWQGAEVLVEHCDRQRPGRPTAKGFLALEQEIEAVRAAGTAGIAINWGRSAIELGDPDGVPGHVRTARESGLLRGVIFSGTAAEDSEYGPAWADAHLPFAPDHDEGRPGAEHSLLTGGHARAALAAAGPSPWLGLKIACRPQQATIAQRVALIRDGVERLTRAAIDS